MLDKQSLLDHGAELAIINSKHKAIVDIEFYPLLSRHKWSLANAERNGNGIGWVTTKFCNRSIPLHSMIMGGKSNKQVDHINRNTLDNRLENLRFVSASAQAQNKVGRNADSEFKGVRYRKKDRHWYAGIMQDKRMYYLGSFHDELGAAFAYDMAALYFYGENAYLNLGDERLI